MKTILRYYRAWSLTKDILFFTKRINSYRDASPSPERARAIDFWHERRQQALLALCKL